MSFCTWSTAMLVATLLAGCGGSESECGTFATPECPDRPDDESGYAQLICQYAVDEGFDYPDVGALSVKRVVSGVTADPQGKYGSERYVFAHLDCCFAGDTAVIDTDLCKVVEIRLAQGPDDVLEGAP